jgi:pyruvate dehydrogenase E1 component alpha subunit
VIAEVRMSTAVPVVPTSAVPPDLDHETVQLLAPDGRRVEHPDYPLTISDDEIRGLYRDLILTRRLDSEAIALQRQGELGLWASALGQEAAQIGAGRALATQDMCFPSYREHGIALCRGIDPLSLLGNWRGTDFGGFDPHAFNFANYTIVIGSQTLHAAGYAMGVVRDGAVGTGDPAVDTAVLACFGDGATSQGDVHEAFVWASADNLPIVFFLQNNQWAISAPVTTQSRTPLYRRAAGYGMPGVRVDGNDVLACLAVTRRALEDARAGAGPSLIEAFTYRMNPHTTNDDPRRYRTEADNEHWRALDPIARVRSYLEREAGTASSFFAEVEDQADAFAERIRAGVRVLPEPTSHTVFGMAYSDPPPDLLEQQQEFDEFLKAVNG